MTQAPRLDLHVHTRASPDSYLSLDMVLRDALVQGLQGVAVTDHNTVAALPAARRMFDPSKGFLFLPGVEVSTVEGHLLVYGVDRAPRPRRPLAETLEEVRGMNGVPVLAHPFRWAHGAGRRAAESAAVLGIEAMNGRNSEVPNAKASLIGSKRHLAMTGGSDAHETGSVGRCFTVFEGEATTTEDLLELLRAGKVSAAGKDQTLGGRVRISFTNAGKRILRGFSGV